jgi:hypothetical protein
MDLTDKTDWEILKRILALYLSLARIADRACGRSRFVRWLVLWTLRRAEFFALQWIAEAEPWLYPSLSTPRHDTLSEARRLARCFRAAARSVKKLLRTMARCKFPLNAKREVGRVAQPPSRSAVYRAFVAVKSLFARTAPRFVERLDSS